MASVKAWKMNVSQTSFTDLRVNPSGAKTAYVNYNGEKRPFSIQTPWMDIPFQVSEYQGGETTKYSLTLSFRGMDSDSKLKGFHDRMVEMEQRFIQGGVDNSSAWFRKKNLTKEVVENLFTPMVKVSLDKETNEPDGKWPPSIRVKIPYYMDKETGQGTFACKLSGVDGTEYKLNEAEGDNIQDILVKGARTRCILQCVGIWIASGKFGCTWKVVQAEVEVPEAYTDAGFLPDSDDEDEDAQTTTETSGGFIDDSDDEKEDASASTTDAAAEEEPEVVEEAPAKPAKKVTKKRVTKSKK